MLELFHSSSLLLRESKAASRVSPQAREKVPPYNCLTTREYNFANRQDKISSLGRNGLRDIEIGFNGDEERSIKSSSMSYLHIRIKK